MGLNGKRIVIVGGSSGIGYAVAEAALAQGAEVIVASSGAEKVEAAAARLGVRGVAFDVRDEAQVSAGFEAIGAFDHLVFTAGDWGARNGGVAPDRPGAVFDVRFWGAMAVVRKAAPLMPADGSVTLTDGMIAHKPRRGAALSTAMAGALEHLVRGLAVDLAPIRVNAVCPGPISTGVWGVQSEEQQKAQAERLARTQLLPRMGEPSEVAEAYLYLMRAGFTTGQILRVDGGASLR
jgi:NAD(P)-dependent dehydrogenase (short-subunit alcohol dehydrogenase family)